eukprot:TRINITY_DN12502_c0_g1_i5.p4 TRINITY_DN12502_c0_g1~~TRINITY_DN12502_c0_g1_i5.p4  ORF type:complete len:173 (-),score=5.11 TRINITY_DN12502_c0_g1_i5:1542-2060(-)
MPLRRGHITIDVFLLKPFSQSLQGKHIIRKDDDLVATLFVFADQKLAVHELDRVANTQLQLEAMWVGLLAILRVEQGRHLAPSLDTLHASNVSIFLQVHPVCLIELRPNQEPQILDFAVFTDQCCRQSQLAMGWNGGQQAAKLLCGHGLHLIQDHDAPFVCFEKVDDTLSFF